MAGVEEGLSQASCNEHCRPAGQSAVVVMTEVRSGRRVAGCGESGDDRGPFTSILQLARSVQAARDQALDSNVTKIEGASIFR